MKKADNFYKYLKLRKQYKQLVFESFAIQQTSSEIRVTYSFRLDNKYFFTPSLIIPHKAFIKMNRISDDLLNNLLFHVGMIELVSYWKAACPEEILIKPYHLNEAQKLWWKALYYKGLGEFFYLNSIITDKESFVNIISSSNEVLEPGKTELSDSFLIPVGGGKDSPVTIELLAKPGNIPLILNPRGATLKTAEVAGYNRNKIFEVHRTIDPVLLGMNDQGFLNGHTPFSALLAFISLLCAALSGCRNIALSNESSANESTVSGSEVNHQFSKSFEFEQGFREYYMKYISNDFNYFSFLRPLNELQIAKIFSSFVQYHDVFRSCNQGSKTDSWCGCCAKCLFAYIILLPFISVEKLSVYFGKDILDDINLRHEFDQLIGLAETKPFECVGTIDEINAAIMMFLDKNVNSDLPALLRYYLQTENYKRYKRFDTTALMKVFDNENYLNSLQQEIIKRYLYA